MMSKNLSWSPTLLDGPPLSQRRWKLASISAHALLSMSLIAAGRAAGPDLRHPSPIVDVVLIAPPRGQDTGEPFPSRWPTSQRPHAVGISVDLDQMTLSIYEDPSYELIKVLRRSGGYVGIAEAGDDQAPIPYVDRIFSSSDLRETEPSQTRRIDDYFAVRLVHPEVWASAIGLTRAVDIGAGTAAVFALFPQSFATELQAAVRECATTKHLTAVKSVTIRFDVREVRGIVIEDIS